MIAEQQESALVLQHSEGFLDLLRVDRDQIVAAQKSDSLLRSLSELLDKGVAKKTVSFQSRRGVLYRPYKDKKMVQYDQLVLPSKYRDQILNLSHG